MFGKQMIELETRKKALLLESDLNRLRLRTEVSNLRELAKFSNHLPRLRSWRMILPQLVAVVVALGAGRTLFAGGLLRRAMVAAPAFIRLWRTVSAFLAEFRQSRYS